MSKKETHALAIGKLRRHRNILFVCAVLAAGSSTFLTSQLLDAQSKLRADGQTQSDMYQENQSLMVQNKYLTTQVDSISKACVRFEQAALSAAKQPSWRTAVDPPRWAPGGPSECAIDN